MHQSEPTKSKQFSFSLKALLIFLHRWLGVAMCLVFLLWFASGIVMIFVQYPQFTENESLDNSAAIEFSRINLSPSEALGRASVTEMPGNMSLLNVIGRPAYQFISPSRGYTTVFADDGSFLRGVSEAQAMTTVEKSNFHDGQSTPEYGGVVNIDQWTISVPRADRPLHWISLGDADGTVLYISSQRGRIVQDTTRKERFWNWFGSTIHWIYPLQIRQHASLWSNIVIYLSVAGLLSVLSGGIIGVLKLRVVKPLSGKFQSPYVGMLKWHHLIGLFTMVIIFTFTFSGLMSMEPWGLFSTSTSARQQVARYTGSSDVSLELLPDPRELKDKDGVKEVQWKSILGHSYMVAVRDLDDSEVEIVDDSGLNEQKFLAARIVGAIPKLLPHADLSELDIISSYDNYYYSRHNSFRPLPIYRAKFNDDEGTWYHINSQTGEVINRLTKISRVQRWIYSALHNLDFSWLLSRPPLWYSVLMALSMIGLFFSITGIIIAWRRLRNL